MNKATLLTLPCLMATLLCPGLAPGEEFLLYAPKPAESAAVPANPEEGILVRNITIKGGDSLSKISREYSGHGSWYPQLLLFNKIKDPNLIYSGDTILVPISPERGVPAETTAPQKSAKVAKPGKGHKAVKTGKGAKAAKAGKVVKSAAATKSAKPAKVVKPVKVSKVGKVQDEKRTEPTTVVSPAAPGVKAPKAERPAKPAKVESAKPATSTAQVTMAGELDGFRQAKDAYLAGQYQKALDLFADFVRRFPNSSSVPEAELYRADSLLHLAGQ
jgi:hypothetical protein